MKRLAWLLVMMGLFVTGMTFAQADQPLILVMDATLYTWDGTPNQAPTVYDACIPDGEPIISAPIVSPNGRNVAFLTQPKEVTQVLQEIGGVGGGPLPNQLYTCGTGLGGDALTLVGSQPDDFSFFADDVPDKGIVFSEAVWSPDSNMLAWTELPFPGEGINLGIYDLNTGNITATELEGVSLGLGVPSPLTVYWGEAGVMVFNASLDDETFELTESLFIYDSKGNPVAQTVLPTSDESDFPQQRVLMNVDGEEFFAVLFAQSGWQLIEPLSGEAQPANGFGELYNPNNPNGMGLLFEIDESFNQVWTVVMSDGAFVDANGNLMQVNAFTPNQLALSSDSQLVFTVFDGAYVWNGGDSTFINGTEAVANGFSALAWGPTAWRLNRTALSPPQQAEPVTCAGALSSRLIVGEQAGVVETTVPNNVRNSPNLGGGVVGQIPGGSTFTVLSGPVCADGYAWWEVNFNGIIGWTVEGDADSYWLEPR